MSVNGQQKVFQVGNQKDMWAEWTKKTELVFQRANKQES